MLALNQPQNIARSRQQAWELLYDLSTFSEASYRACRIIRSHQVTDIEVYVTVRLSHSLEQPIKHRVRKLLQSAVKYRQMSWPVSSLPLRLPFLAHDSFPANIQQWLRRQVFQFKHLLVPFHLPSAKVREAPHESIVEHLHNVRDWNVFFEDSQLECSQLPCPCLWYKDKLPDDAFSDGHVTAGLEQLWEIEPSATKLSQGSALSSFFPAQSKYFDLAYKAFDRWRFKHGLPLETTESFRLFMSSQWPLHLDAVYAQRRIVWKDLQRIKDKLGSKFVIHNEDHHNGHLMLRCPRFYFTSIFRTWADASVFSAIRWNTRSMERSYQIHCSPESTEEISLGIPVAEILGSRIRSSETEEVLCQRQDHHFVLPSTIRRILVGALLSVFLA